MGPTRRWSRGRSSRCRPDRREPFAVQVAHRAVSVWAPRKFDQSGHMARDIGLRCGCLVVCISPLRVGVLRSALEGDSVLLPLGPPLPPDAVAAKRGESGLLCGLSVPLSWGTAVPPDDYDHWAPEPEEGAEAVVEENVDAAAAGTDEWDEWAEWREWEAANAEPHFEMPRTSSVIPNSPAAG